MEETGVVKSIDCVTASVLFDRKSSCREKDTGDISEQPAAFRGYLLH